MTPTPPPPPPTAEDVADLRSETRTTTTNLMRGIALELEDPSQVQARRPFPGATPQARARACTELRVALWMTEVAANLVYLTACESRAAGVSWAQLAPLLGITAGSQDELAAAAFRRIAGEATTMAVASVSYVCDECAGHVIDVGPSEPDPELRERGHTETCQRQQAAVVAYLTRAD